MPSVSRLAACPAPQREHPALPTTAEGVVSGQDAGFRRRLVHHRFGPWVEWPVRRRYTHLVFTAWPTDARALDVASRGRLVNGRL